MGAPDTASHSLPIPDTCPAIQALTTAPGCTYEHTATDTVELPEQSLTMCAVGMLMGPPLAPCSVRFRYGGYRDSSFACAALTWAGDGLRFRLITRHALGCGAVALLLSV